MFGYLVFNNMNWSWLEDYNNPLEERIYGVHQHFYDILIEGIENWLNV